MSPNESDDVLIPKKWGPILSAIATVLASLVIWLVQVAGSVDGRIRQLEVNMNHLVDQNGNARPSNATVDALGRIKALEVKVDILEKQLGIEE